MRGITGYLLGAAGLALLGGVCLAVGTLEREMAHAQQRFATLHYEEPTATFDTAERYFEYGSRLPWIGNAPLNEVRARRAALRYWQRQYGTIVPRQAEPVSAIAPENIELQLVVANAVYRTGQSLATDRTTMLAGLDAGILAYLTVLKNATRQEDAAFNYEYVVRLRDDIDKGRRKPGPSAAEANGPLGRAGAPPIKTSNANEFKVYIPLESEERTKSDEEKKKSEGQRKSDDNKGDAGKAAPRGRKG